MDLSLQVATIEKRRTHRPGHVDLARDRFDISMFLANFETLVAAVGGAGRLRKLVLELAIRGKLTGGLPKDDSADQLFALAHEDRVDRQRRGHARQMGELTGVSETEAPFALPATWVWSRIGLAVNLVNGRAFKPQDWSASGLPIVRIQNLNNADAPFNCCAFEVEPKHLVSPGDFLISWSGTPGTSFGAFIWNGPKGVLNQHIFRAEIYAAAFELGFLRIAINARLDEMIAQAHGAVGLQHITKGKLEALAIPLPPLAEQKRVVARVDQLMALIDDLEAKQNKKRDFSTRFTKASLKALTIADSPEAFDAACKRVVKNFPTVIDWSGKVRELRKAICELGVRGTLATQASADLRGEDLLSEVATARATLIERGELRISKTREAGLPLEAPFSVPESWTWTQVGDTYDVVGGIQKTPLRAPTKNHYPYLRVENVQRNRLSLDRIERFELEDGELARWKLSPGDLLVVEGNGSEHEIGRCALWAGEIDDCVHQNHLIRCRPIGPIWSPFLLLFLNSPSGAAEMRNLAITTSGLYSLSVGKIRGIWWPVPPLSEQKRIVAKVEQLMKLCDDLEAKLLRAEDSASKLMEAVIQEVVA
jgi:type I restriction enzyme S subunit